MASPPETSHIRDFWPRMLISPFLGAVVAWASGLIDNARHSGLALAAHYAAFTVVALVIWEGNRRLYFSLRRHAPSLERPGFRILRMGAVLALFTVPVSGALLLAWRTVSGDPSATDTAVALAVLMATVSAAVVTHGYETVFLRREWEAERGQVTRFERARLRAELDVLQRETNPHFLYNALNSLLHLIEADSAQAARFVEALAAHYRHVLDTRDHTLVSLADEFAALEQFQVLVRIRFGAGVQLVNHVTSADAGRWWLPPLCLQELFENAIKHTSFSEAKPLDVRVSLERHELVVSNRFEPAGQTDASTHLGLANMDERLRIITGRPLRWGREDGRFVVRVPLAASATPHL